MHWGKIKIDEKLNFFDSFLTKLEEDYKKTGIFKGNIEIV